MEEGNHSLENTPTWAVSIVCFCFFLVSFLTDAALHLLAKFIRKRKHKSLSRALQKIKAEMMTLGFVSLLLTVSEAPMSKICVTEAVANSFLPCKTPNLVSSSRPNFASSTQTSGSKVQLSSNTTDDIYCEAKGMVSVMSREGVMQLKIFISVLAVFHILHCMLTMCLGMAKMQRWKAWEEETQSLEYRIVNDSRRFQLPQQTPFGQRHLKLWSHHPFLLWPVCFIRQFRGSVSKVDYFTLRYGFIVANLAEGSSFNFHRFLVRAFDDDFEQVVGIRLWIWIFSILFIFFSANVFHNYYWLPFIPLLLALGVGTKLEVIITKMCVESSKTSRVVQGNFRVKSSNHLFWFAQPKWLLHLLQFILIQNSFQLAFFTWAWYEYGLRSCFNRDTGDIIIRVTMCLAVQFLCGYVTLPIYALVTQMGSGMNKVVFTERVIKGLKNWHQKATRQRRLLKNASTSSTHSSNLEPNSHLRWKPSSASMSPPTTTTTTTTAGDHAEQQQQHDSPVAEAITNASTPEITREEADSRVDAATGSYDGEISFASGWKNLESNRVLSSDFSSLDQTDGSSNKFDE